MYYSLPDLNVYIREATINDIDNVYSIEAESFGKHHWSKQLFYNEFSNNFSSYYVSCLEHEEGKIIGYIGYWKVLDEGHITTLAVAVPYRRNHIADILLYNLIRSALTKKVKWLTLEVRASNYAAINLYSKFQFKQLGIRKKYYQDNDEDGLILWTENINNPNYTRAINDTLSDILSKDGIADKLQYSIA